MSQAHAKRALAAIQRAHSRGLASVVTLERPGKKGEYDPSTGTTKPDGPPKGVEDLLEPGYVEDGYYGYTLFYKSVGIKAGYSQNDIDGTLIKQGDQQLYVAADGFIRPKTNERIQVGSETYSIASVQVVAPGTTDILYELQIRGLL